MYIYVIEDDYEIKQKKILYSSSNKTFMEDNDFLFGEGRWAKTMIEARELLEDLKDERSNKRD